MPPSAPVGDDHSPTAPYPLAVDEQELDRLDRQGRALAPATRFILESAGVREGMRLLDLGSGTGDTALVASELVGPAGRVLGVDRSPEAVAHATRRAAERGLGNVIFQLGDIHDRTHDEGPFDAVMGRLVLMYASDPAAVLRARAAELAPGGIVVTMEFDVSSCRSLPAVPLMDQLVDVAGQAFERAGVDMSLGPKLWRTMASAGLRPEGMVSVQPHFGPDDPDGAGLLAGILRSAAPLIERAGMVSAEQLGVDTYETRLRVELTEAAAVVAYPTFYGVWGSSPRS